MLISQKCKAAIEAYKAGESALSIEQRLGVRNQMLYRWLKHLKVPLHRDSRPRAWCKWCGDTLPRSKQRFCSNQCREDHRRSLYEEHVMHCPECSKAVPSKNHKYCGKECAAAAKAREWAARAEQVAKYRTAGLSLRQIGDVLNISAETIRKRVHGYYSPNEDALLRKMRRLNMSTAEMAKEMQRSISSIQKRLLALGIQYPAGQGRKAA